MLIGKLAAATLAGIACATALTGPAGATPPNSGCPKGGGWYETTAPNATPPPSYDSTICAKDFEHASSKAGVGTYKDNTNPRR
jgi:hypothetical protein